MHHRNLSGERQGQQRQLVQQLLLRRRRAGARPSPCKQPARPRRLTPVNSPGCMRSRSVAPISIGGTIITS